MTMLDTIAVRPPVEPVNQQRRSTERRDDGPSFDDVFLRAAGDEAPESEVALGETPVTTAPADTAVQSDTARDTAPVGTDADIETDPVETDPVAADPVAADPTDSQVVDTTDDEPDVVATDDEAAGEIPPAAVQSAAVSAAAVTAAATPAATSPGSATDPATDASPDDQAGTSIGSSEPVSSEAPTGELLASTTAVADDDSTAVVTDGDTEAPTSPTSGADATAADTPDPTPAHLPRERRVGGDGAPPAGAGSAAADAASPDSAEPVAAPPGAAPAPSRAEEAGVRLNQHIATRELFERIEQHRRANDGSIELKIMTERFGTLRIEATEGRNGVHLSLRSDGGDDRALADLADELRHEFDRSDIDLAGFDVGERSRRDHEPTPAERRAFSPIADVDPATPARIVADVTGGLDLRL